MRVSIASSEVLFDERSETLRTLEAMAGRRAKPLPADWVARHIVSLYGDAGWSVCTAAFEAIVRRLEIGRAQELRARRRPRLGLGEYAIAADGDELDEVTELESLEPLRASCDCDDFARASLGLCKHVLVAVVDLVEKHGRFRPLIEARRRERSLGTRLEWDPVRPLRGDGDWLARVSLHAPTGTAHVPAAVVRWFDVDPRSRRRVLKADARSDRDSRSDAVADLLDWIDAGARAPVALEALLEDEHRRLQRLDLAPPPSDTARAIASLAKPLYPHQRDAVERFVSTMRLLLADDMGVGKTAQAIAACHVLAKTRRVRRGLLVVPSTLKPQWLDEWSRFTDLPLAVADGGREKRLRLYRPSREGFVMTSYEQARQDIDAIWAWQPEVAVLDEAQRIKNAGTQTARAIKQIDADYRLALTGTPLENRLAELGSIVEWVDDMALAPSWRLSPAHTRTVDGGREVGGVVELDTLRARLAPVFLRRRRYDILAELPERRDWHVPVEVTPAQQCIHKRVAQPIAVLVGIAKKRPLKQDEILRLMGLFTFQRVVANGMALHAFERLWPEVRNEWPAPAVIDRLRSPKLFAMREIVEQVVIGEGRKVVVFSQWRRMLELARWATADLLDREGLRACFFTGQESSRQRTKNVVDFHDDPRMRIFFATDAGGVGLNLQRAASCCVNLEVPWNPAVREQRIGRIHRLGQRDAVDVYDLVSTPSIEAKILGSLADKQALFTGLFDTEDDEVVYERGAGFVARAIRIVESETPAGLVARLTSGQPLVGGPGGATLGRR